MRFAILVSLSCLLLGSPALALGTKPIHPTPAVERETHAAVLTRTERWRGSPYTRARGDHAVRDGLDKALTREADLTAVPSLREDDPVRREALDKRIPVNPYNSYATNGTGIAGF